MRIYTSEINPDDDEDLESTETTGERDPSGDSDGEQATVAHQGGRSTNLVVMLG